MPNPRSTWKNQYFLYPNASLFHNDLREVFTTDPFFKQLNCYQEVLLSDLVDDYPNNYDSVDWYVDELNLVIELHGKQHYEMVKFSNSKSFLENQIAFNNIKYRDNRKKTFLQNANYLYEEISYKDAKKISSQYLKTLIFT
tara:strand:- start:457 stop:879 length:423 start_codon:yes stop_codon:yes gene_type:complete